MLKHKSAALTVEAKDGGAVHGYASTFDREPDSYGDVIAPDAFDATLAKWRESGKPIPLLWGHDTFDPTSNIGGCTDYGTDERGLWFDADFDADNPKAQYVRKLLKEGRVFQCSFAFDVGNVVEVDLADGAKANELHDIDLFEISIVQIPANQHAEVIEVKTSEQLGNAERTTTVKYGRRNSKADEDTIAEVREHLGKAMTLLDGLTDSGEGDGDEEEKDAAGEPSDDAQTSGGKGAAVAGADLIAMLKSIEEED